ncbi:MAG: Xaa-Pro peptidase family protein [Thermoactinomyces sp.]
MQRVERLRKKMAEKNLEAFLITHPVNRRYMTGFTGTSGVALLTKNDAIFITDFRYVTQAREQCPDWSLVKHEGSIFSEVAKVCRKIGLNQLAFEQDHLTYGEVIQLREMLEEIETVPAGGLVEELREVKEPEELLIMKEAAKIADEAFAQIVQEIRPGMKEREVALRLEVIMRELGAISSSFDTIVASGWRSALPHGVASDKVIEKGDFVTMDYGAYYKGYASDITRTVLMGKPDPKQKEIYEIVLEANRRAIEGVRPGKTGKEIDAIARDYIREHGYGDYFGHGTGHGLGMEVHEEPRVSSRGDKPLVPGMVITIEPGIYLPDFGGVRIEDDLIVTESGYEKITGSPKELLMIR